MLQPYSWHFASQDNNSSLQRHPQSQIQNNRQNHALLHGMAAQKTARQRIYRRMSFMNVTLLTVGFLASIFIVQTVAVPTTDVAGMFVHDGVDDDLNLPLHARHLLVRRAFRYDNFSPAAAVPAMSASMIMEQLAPTADAVAMMTASAGAGTSAESKSEPTQGQCLLDGIMVSETTVFCEQQAGCRAIQKTGHCCPDYKCDCQKDGKTYANGDKLVDPENPCTVCYCKGGEILCSSVTCFHRDDCTPKYINGRCCPEYDDCPIAKMNMDNKTISLDPVTSAPNSSPPTLLNPKITIKEITKPIEIRFTDNNKSMPQMVRQSTSTTTTSTTTTTTSTTSSPTTEAAISQENTSGTAVTTLTSVSTVNDASSELTASTKFTNSQPSTYITMLSESTTKAPIRLSVDTNQHKTDTFPGGISAEVQEPLTLKLTPVMEYSGNGNTNNNNNDGRKSTTVVVTSSVDTLDQRVEESDTLNKVNIKRDNFQTTEASPASTSVSTSPAEFDIAEMLYSSSPSSGSSSSYLVDLGAVDNSTSFHSQKSTPQATSVELEPDTSGSENIYHIILTTDGPPRSDSSTERTTEKSIQHFVHSTEGVESHITTEGPPTQSSTTTNFELLELSSTLRTLSENASTESTESFSSTTDSSTIVSSTTESHHPTEEEDTALPVESNPAYPSLPEDDFSVRFPASEVDDGIEPDEPRSSSTSIVSDSIKGTKKLETVLSGSGDGIIAEQLFMPSSTESSTFSGNDLSSSSTETMTAMAKLRAELMFSIEDSSDETLISNNTDFRLSPLTSAERTNDSNGLNVTIFPESIDSLEASVDGSGGSDEMGMLSKIDPLKSKRAEPTTPRPTTARTTDVDIDELESASGDGNAMLSTLDDPKLDAESLKLDETETDGMAASADATAKGSVLNIKINPAQDRTLIGYGNIAERVQQVILQRLLTL